MSFLRFASPGQPTIIVDQGPSTAHRSRASVGGELVMARKALPLPIPATTGARRKQIAEARRRREGKDRCGIQSRRMVDVCWRSIGHAGPHATQAALNHEAALRRGGKSWSIHPENRR